MSVLLDALKKAALEKAGKSAEEIEEALAVFAPVPEPVVSIPEEAQPASPEPAPEPPPPVQPEPQPATEEPQADLVSDPEPDPIPERAAQEIIEEPIQHSDPTPDSTAEESFDGIDEALFEEVIKQPAAADNGSTDPDIPTDMDHDFRLPEDHTSPEAVADHFDEVAEQPQPEPAPWDSNDADFLLEESQSDEEELDLDLEFYEEEPPEVENPLAMARERKAALAQLLQKSRKVADNYNRRSRILYTILSAIAGLAIIGYNFYLNSEEPMPVTVVQTAPMPSALLVPGEDSMAQEAGGNAVADVRPADTVAADTSPESLVSDLGEVVASVGDNLISQEQPPTAASESETAVEESTAVTAAQPEQESIRQIGSRSEEPQTASQQLTVKRATRDPALNRHIRNGYDAYAAGDLEGASAAYQRALRAEPGNRDALLGAAAAASRLGRSQEAMRLYQQCLDRWPRDTYALSGILALAGRGASSPELESELKILIAENPQAAHLHFLQGAINAQKGEWLAAQRAFFDARHHDNTNPDYSFNLAVSLDHLQQQAQALIYYRDALRLAQSHTASFNTQQAQQRISLLEAAQ